MTDRDREIGTLLSRVADPLPVDVEGRLRSLHAGPSLRGPRRVITVALAVALAAAAIVFAVRALAPSRARTPGSPTDPTGRIAFTRATDQETHHELYLVNADGMSVTHLVDGSGKGSFAEWSPDGTQIAFLQDEGSTGSTSNLFVMNADGTGLMQLTHATNVLGLDWSPDGSEIVYVSNTPDGTSDIRVVHPDGTSDTRILEGFYDSVSWSSDGTRLALTGRPVDGRNLDLYVVNADGSGLRPLTDDAAPDQYAAWSPDGTEIAFMRNEDVSSDYHWDIDLIRPNGTGLTKVTDWSGLDAIPVWAPDGHWIAFASDRGATAEQLANNEAGGNGVVGISLYVMRADGTDVRQLVAGGADEVFPTDWR